MRKTYLSVLSIITAVLCVAGLLYHFGLTDHIFSFGKSSDKSGNMSETLTYSGFSAIDIDVSVANIRLSYSDTTQYQVFYNAPSEKYIPTIKLSGQTLKIDQKVKNASSNSVPCEIVIIIPKNSELKSVEIDAGIGNVEADFQKITYAEIKAGVGDVKISDCTISSISMNAGVGNVSFTNNSIQKTDINAGMGNVQINGIGDLSEYTLEIDHVVGSLTIGSHTQSGLGSEYVQTGSTSKQITIDAGMGNVTITE